MDREKCNRSAMLKNYFLITFRSLRRNRGFGWINIAGLAIGIACAALIFLWVEDELNFDHVFAKRDHLYRIMENQRNNGTWITANSTPGPMAEAVRKEIPGIEQSARLSWNMDQLFAYDDKSIKDNGLYADPSLLQMLSLSFIRGDRATALNQPQSVVISESLSRKFFGDADPIGKIVTAKGKQSYSVDGVYTVTGVFRDLPSNASYSFRWISPYTVFENKNDWMKPWNNNLTETLVELDPTSDPVEINKKLKDYLKIKNTGSATECFLFSMNNWHLRSHFTNGESDGGGIRYVKLFSLIAGLILLIACINFMNLATARSEQRAREVGVRKVLGAGRKKLMGQFLAESMLFSFMSVILAIGLSYLVLPLYNQLVDKNLSPAVFQPLHLGFLVGIGSLCGLIAGSYPAVYLSSFNPIGVLKGLRIKSSGGVILLRKGLVITQFAAGIVFIISTVIIYQQLMHVRQRDLGYSKDNLITMDLQGSLKEQFPNVKNQLLSTGMIENAAMSLHSSLHVYSYGSGFDWQGKDPDTKFYIYSNMVSPEYLSTMHMKLLQGRGFYADYKADSGNVIITDALARSMGPEGRINGIIHSGSITFHIVGIIGDLVYNDMYAPPAPMIFACVPGAATQLTIRLKAGVETGQAMAKVKRVIETANPGYPFEYRFLDEEFGKLFATETLVGKLAGVFAVLAIFISCLGLFSLAAYTAERRTKEIGVRKVLGASMPRLIMVLSMNFLLLVGVSCLIAFPVAWWVMHAWLKDYAYRTSIHWWVFGAAAGSALVIALLTISWQAVKAAIANPVKSLRIE